jgi:hypothetical protein
MGQRTVFKTELPHLAGRGINQTFAAVGQGSYQTGENNNSSDHPAQTGSELSQLPFATCPVDRRNPILLTSQSPGKTTSELPLVGQYQDGTPKE